MRPQTKGDTGADRNYRDRPRIDEKTEDSGVERGFRGRKRIQGRELSTNA
jgi:hypothetical protein